MFVERVGSLCLFAIFLWVLSLPHIHSFFLSFFNSFFLSYLLFFCLSFFLFLYFLFVSLLCSAFHHHPHLLCLSDQAHLLSISSSPDIVNQPHSELQRLPGTLSVHMLTHRKLSLCLHSSTWLDCQPCCFIFPKPPHFNRPFSRPYWGRFTCKHPDSWVPLPNSTPDFTSFYQLGWRSTITKLSAEQLSGLLQICGCSIRWSPYVNRSFYYYYYNRLKQLNWETLWFYTILSV